MHTRSDALLLGEWACLGVVASKPSHGFEVSKRLVPEGDVGRIWSLSRPLCYRSLDQLRARGLIAPVRSEPGIAGGNRTVLKVTPAGRRALLAWLDEPVQHLRDIRNELLLKLQVHELLGRDPATLIAAQQAALDPVIASLRAEGRRSRDPIELWRYEAAAAARRFLAAIGCRGAVPTGDRAR